MIQATRLRSFSASHQCPGSPLLPLMFLRPHVSFSDLPPQEPNLSHSRFTWGAMSSSLLTRQLLPVPGTCTDHTQFFPQKTAAPGDEPWGWSCESARPGFLGDGGEWRLQPTADAQCGQVAEALGPVSRLSSLCSAAGQWSQVCGQPTGVPRFWFPSMLGVAGWAGGQWVRPQAALSVSQLRAVQT